jgi:hypothetical protein
MAYGLVVYTYTGQWIPYDASTYPTIEAARSSAERKSKDSGAQLRVVELAPDPLPNLNPDSPRELIVKAIDVMGKAIAARQQPSD